MRHNLATAQGWVKVLERQSEDEHVLLYATLVNAYATLAIAEKLYEERDAPDLTEEEYWEKAERIASWLGVKI